MLGIIIALFAIALAQILKLPLHLLQTGKWDWSRLFETGGMPSSHSAAVTSLTAFIGLTEGFNSIYFAISTIFSLIVMYDAMGIRRHAGEIAMQVNDLDEDVEKLAGDHPGIYHKRRTKELKEKLGHQPVEVVGGAVFGIAIGLLSYWLIQIF